MKLKLPFLIALLLFFKLSKAQTPYSLDSAWIMNNYYKIERYIPMRDGIKLFTAIYLPKDTTELHPILLKRTPYGIYPYGEENMLHFWVTYYRHFMRENYIYVEQDVRGKNNSEGEFIDVRPYLENKKGTQTDEASDSYDTIDWLVKNLPYNNGRVGASGISYPGFYATMVALSGHPAVKAVSPEAPVTDWFMGDDVHHNGAFFLMDVVPGISGFGQPSHNPSIRPHFGYTIPSQDKYDFYLRTGALSNFTRLMGDSIQFWKDINAHPDLDNWWKARNIRNFVQNIPSSTATLEVGGLFDAEDLFGAWNLYKAIEQKAHNNNKIVMGPWFHGQWGGLWDGSYLGHVRFGSKTADWYINNVEIPFFDYYLLGKGDSSTIAEATIFFTGDNEWRRLKQWPPKNVTPEKLYLHSNGELSWDKPSSTGYSQYTSDPAKPVPFTDGVISSRTKEYMTDDQRFSSERPDVLVFKSDSLTSDVTVAGPLYADLFASISTSDADFIVKLIDVYPEYFKYPEDLNYHEDLPLQGKSPLAPYPMGGYQQLVRAEIMRGRYRNSFEHPQPFTPGNVEGVKYYMPDVAHTFKKGHCIMVQIQSSWFPLVDRNPQKFVHIYHASASDFQKSDIKIYHSSQYPSSIILPIVNK
jgi:uncharacterized protein